MPWDNFFLSRLIHNISYLILGIYTSSICRDLACTYTKTYCIKACCWYLYTYKVGNECIFFFSIVVILILLQIWFIILFYLFLVTCPWWTFLLNSWWDLCHFLSIWLWKDCLSQALSKVNITMIFWCLLYIQKLLVFIK